MLYVATLDGQEHEFEVEETGADGRRLTLGGKVFDLDLRQVGRASFSVLVGGRAFDFDVTREGDEMVVASRAGATRVTVENAGRRAARASRGDRQVSGRAEIKAMMPGRVVNVLVKVGDEVRKDQGILIVEAMKMENEIKAPKDGKVTAVKTEPGKTVERGDLMVVIE